MGYRTTGAVNEMNIAQEIRISGRAKDQGYENQYGSNLSLIYTFQKSLAPN